MSLTMGVKDPSKVIDEDTKRAFTLMVSGVDKSKYFRKLVLFTDVNHISLYYRC